MTKHWYIVQAYSNFEDEVSKAILERLARHNLEDELDQVVVPSETVIEVRRGKKFETKRRLMPGYVFVKVNLTGQVYHIIKTTPKVTGFLGSANSPSIISESEVVRMIQHTISDLNKPQSSVTFEIGEQVSISDGPFASFSGIVEEVDELRARLKVAVSIFSRATPVELSYSQVSKM